MGAMRVRLGAGVRVSDRSGESLQVGLHPGRSAVLPDRPDVRAVLERLRHGVDPGLLRAEAADVLDRLDAGHLLVPTDEPSSRSRARQTARIALDAPAAEQALTARLLGEAGLAVAGDAAATSSPPARPTASLVVTLGAEPRREKVDLLAQADRPHLLVTAVAGRVRVGPTVVPGITACLRCLDEHQTDQDPRHPLVVEQHLERDPEDRPVPADLQLALAWAVRDLLALVEGRRPVTWSATLDLDEDGARQRSWTRHPRCGCAWADLA